MNDFKLEWAEGVKLQKGQNKTFVANIDNAKGMFVSNECIDIIQNAYKDGVSFAEILDSICDSQSRDYFERLVNRLSSFGMWANAEKTIISPEELEISIDITNECNLRCRHCCISAGDGLRGKDLPKDEMKKILEKVIGLNPHFITISGGEPLIRDDFEELTDYIRKSYAGNLLLMTNAMLIDRDMACYISKNYNYVDVSIDGVDENSCSKIRGKGTFGKTIQGIKHLTSCGCKVSASMVITNDNKNLKQEFKALCEEQLKIRYMFRVFEPIGRGELNKQILQIDSNKNENGEICWENCEKKFVENKLYERAPQIFACQGAKRQFQIDHRGELYPCASMMEREFKLGNVLKIENFSKYILGKEYIQTKGYDNFKKYLPFNVPKCKECNKQLFCFSCANTVKRHIKNKTIDKICEENYKFYDLYWRYYGTC